MYLVSRNIVYRTTMPQSPSKQAPWDLTQFSQSPSAALSYFPESHQQSEISSLSKVILVSGKARSHKVTNLGCSGAESPGWLDVSPKHCTRREAWADVLLWWRAASHHVSIAVAFWIIEIVSMGEWSSLMQNLMQIHCSTCSVILNEMATRYTCSLNSDYCPPD